MTAQSGLGFSGIVAIQIPDDGATGTVLTKLTPDDYDYDWLVGGGAGGDVLTLTIPAGLFTLTQSSGVSPITVDLVDGLSGGFLYKPGFVGGQLAHGGTAATDELRLRGSTDADLGIVNIESPIDIDVDLSVGPVNTVMVWDTSFTTGGAFIGGMIADQGTVTYDNGLFIWALLSEGRRYVATVDPTFAAFTLFNALPVIANSGDVNLTGAIILNAGLVHERTSAGTSVAVQTLGLNYSCMVRALVAGAVMTRTTQTGISLAPVFSTVVGSTANLGVITGLDCFNPVVGLFQTQGGAETMVSYVGLNVQAIPFGGTVTKRALRSALVGATNTLMIENTGGAESDFGAGSIHLNDNAFIKFGNTVAAPDLLFFWDGPSGEFRLSTFLGVGGNPIAIEGFANDVWKIGNSNLGTIDVGFQIDAAAITFGTVAPIPGSVDFFVRFASPALRTPSAGASDYFDVEWNAAGALDVNGETLTDFDGFHVAAPAVILNGGTIDDMSNMHIDSMSSVGATRLQALRVTGRTRIDGLFTFNEATLAQLTANVAALALPANNLGRYVLLQDADANGPWDIQGIVNVQVGDSFVFVNDGANGWRITHQDAAAAAADRIITPSGVAYVVGPDETACLWYDPVATRWRILWGTGA